MHSGMTSAPIYSVTSPGGGGCGRQAELQTLAELPGVLDQQAEETQGRHDDHVVAALLATLRVQEKFGVVLVDRDLRDTKPK